MGNKDIALLKCTSSYPAPIEEANLVMIKDFAERYGVIVGLSDHTLGATAPIVSVCMGAKIIEKHFILDRSIGGPDASFSMNEARIYRYGESSARCRKSNRSGRLPG
jgi:pseudaminic acid synthase